MYNIRKILGGGGVHLNGLVVSKSIWCRWNFLMPEDYFDPISSMDFNSNFNSSFIIKISFLTSFV